MKYKLKRSQQLRQDIESVWDFFTSPDNLFNITPKDMKFKVLYDLSVKEIYEGMIIDYTVTPFLGIHLTVEYELPFGVIGKMAHSLVVKKKLEHIFDYRYQALEQLLNQENS